MTAGEITVRIASPGDIETVRALFVEYAAGVGIDLGFQGFPQELDSLPGKYGEPGGALLIAELDGEPCGCVALRRIDAAVCEMKRLYVREGVRGRGAGGRLVDRIIREARVRGYERMRLDTLPSMAPAQELYRQRGFRDIPAHVFNPVPGARFMEKDLRE
jgi:GNAT superfamily N-acetyltransferase